MTHSDSFEFPQFFFDAFAAETAGDGGAARGVAAEAVPGRVMRVDRDRAQVLTPLGPRRAVAAGRLRQAATDDPTAQPVVGDWVVLEGVTPGADDADVRLRTVLPRRNHLTRRAAGAESRLGTRPRGQTLVANLDHAFIVNGLDRDFNPRRIERFLALAQAGGVDAVIVLNKADTLDEVELDAKLAQVEMIALGAPIHAISAATGAGLDALDRYLGAGRTIALLGSSGVGKSTLLNAWLGVDAAGGVATGPVRESDGRGTHTTTWRETVQLPGGAWAVDTPGLREVGLWVDDADTADGEGDGTPGFADIDALARSCRFADCRHQGEPGCAVQAAVNAGDLAPERLDAHHQLRAEMERLAAGKDRTKARREAKFRKSVTILHKRRQRDKHNGR
jgi:ribosome biogenesis GTPase